MKTALVAGYTGLVGSLLLNKLLNSNSYNKVIAIGRRKIDLDHPKLHQQEVDFNNLVLEDEIDDVFCCLGTTIGKAGTKEKFRLVDYQYPLNIAIAAKDKGAVSFLLVSAKGASKNSGFFYNQVKGELEESIQQIGYPKLDFLRPSLLIGDRSESRIFEQIGVVFMKVFGFLFVGPLKNVKGINADAVASAMLYFANDGGLGKRIHNSGDMQSFNK